MVQNIQSIEEFHQLIQTYPLVVIHVMREHCSVCHAVLPQIQDLLNEYPHAKLGLLTNRKFKILQGNFLFSQFLLT